MTTELVRCENVTLIVEARKRGQEESNQHTTLWEGGQEGVCVCKAQPHRRCGLLWQRLHGQRPTVQNDASARDWGTTRAQIPSAVRIRNVHCGNAHATRGNIAAVQHALQHGQRDERYKSRQREEQQRGKHPTPGTPDP